MCFQACYATFSPEASRFAIRGKGRIRTCNIWLPCESTSPVCHAFTNFATFPLNQPATYLKSNFLLLIKDFQAGCNQTFLITLFHSYLLLAASICEPTFVFTLSVVGITEVLKIQLL